MLESVTLALLMLRHAQFDYHPLFVKMNSIHHQDHLILVSVCSDCPSNGECGRKVEYHHHWLFSRCGIVERKMTTQFEERTQNSSSRRGIGIVIGIHCQRLFEIHCYSIHSVQYILIFCLHNFVKAVCQWLGWLVFSTVKNDNCAMKSPFRSSWYYL